MEQSNVLVAFAQLCLVLTGFVAVFVAFFSGADKPSKPDVHHALSMLVGSVLAFVISLVPLILNGYGMTGTILWYWSSVIGFGLSMAYGGLMLNFSLRLTWDEFKQAGVVHMFTSYTLGLAGGGFLLWNVLANPGPGHYLLAMTLTLMVALLGFLTFAMHNFLKL